MSKVRRQYLTKAVVDKLEPLGDRRYNVWDTSEADSHEPCKGFHVRVAPSGRKSYVVQYRFAGQLRRMTLGEHGELTVDDARELARDARSAAKKGTDPLAQREAAKIAAEEAKAAAKIPQTVDALADAYIEDYAKPQKRTWRADELRLKRHVRPAIGKMRIEDVEAPHVKALYKATHSKAGPREAEHVRVLVQGLFTFALDERLLPADHHNPAAIKKYKRINKGKVHRRTRKVRAGELPALFDALTKLAKTQPRLAAFYRMLLLTGLRSSELRERTWDDLDRDARELTLRETKTGEPRVVPLSDAAIAALPERVVGSPFIFPSPVSPREKPMSQDWTIKKWRDLCASAKVKDVDGNEGPIKDLVLHDLRHTVASALAAAKMDPRDIQKALGHQSMQTTLGYIHQAEKDEARQGLEDMATSQVEIINKARAKKKS